MSKVFVFGKAAFNEHFTNRTQEKQYLKNNFKHGINTMIISPRRWGKTSLVREVANEVNASQSKTRVILMDAFICRSEEEFLLHFATEVIKQTSNKWQDWIEVTKTFLSHFSPKISIGNDPANDFELSLDLNSSKQQSVQEVLNLPEQIATRKNIELVVCIDEFQQVTEYKSGLDFQKKMRACWQLQPNVTYCLYGSKKHILSNLFSKQSMPFYKFGELFFLQKISKEHWIKYICQRFKETEKLISSELAEKICLEVELHSSYVQQLSWLLWVNTQKEANEDLLNEAINDLVTQNSIVYNNYIESLSRYQLNFLRALVNNVHSGFSSQKILKQYNLGTSANITRIKKALENKELIDIDGQEIVLNDPVFALYLKRVLNF